MIVLRSYSPVSYGKIASFCFIRIKNTIRSLPIRKT